MGELYNDLVYDKGLISRFLSGDNFAFEEIYKKYHARVYGLCLRMLKDPSTAEDLTQDVFVNLYRKIGSFKGKAKFSTWLYRLTVNEVLMYLRKKHVKTEFVGIDELPSQDQALLKIVDLSPESGFVDNMNLGRALDLLPNGYKNVFTLHDIEGYEHEEVACILGCSIGTSKSQLHKARLHMRKLLGKKANPRIYSSNELIAA